MFGKMKFIFVLLLLALIIDCKKLRNQSKKSIFCNGVGEKCGAFRKECCSHTCVYDSWYVRKCFSVDCIKEHWYSFTGICAKKK